jgi:hypothetical protein
LKRIGNVDPSGQLFSYVPLAGTAFDGRIADMELPG